jgi:K+-transporting ATPase ATPase C chain
MQALKSAMVILSQAARATAVLAILTGIIFPLMITGIAQLLFADKANGSLIHSADGKVIGSSLIGQGFSQDRYFHPRPSAAGNGYAGEASSGTNLGPTSAKLFEGSVDDPKTATIDESFQGIAQLATAFRKENRLTSTAGVPVDAVTRSGSGLDPDISVQNAELQATRVASARELPLEKVLATIRKQTQWRDAGILGEPRVNVLLLNLALDKER